MYRPRRKRRVKTLDFVINLETVLKMIQVSLQYSSAAFPIVLNILNNDLLNKSLTSRGVCLLGCS